MSEYKSCPPDVDYIEVQGPQGPQGVQGPQGERGPVGPEGKQGPQGLQGIEGCRGPKGDRGPRGEKGDPGRDGRDGAPGPQGPQGLEGPRGCKGNDGNVKFENLTPEQREKLRGPQGLQGKPGPRGERGLQGTPGLQGPQGLQGPRGLQGEPGGQGPRGETGPMGPQGPAGATGPQGPAGNTNMNNNDIKHDATWSSKKIIEYALHGKVNWELYHDSNLGVLGTANGHARNVKILGRTVTNYSTLSRDFKDEATATYKEASAKRITLYDLEVPGVHEVGQPSALTVIYKMRDRAITLGSYKAKFLITVTNPQTDPQGERPQVIEQLEEINGDVVKHIIDVTGNQKIKKIEIAPIYVENGEEPDVQSAPVRFKVNGFMLIRGHWKDQITPEYFYGTKGVGAKASEISNKYDIVIESMNKNILNENNTLENFYLNIDVPGAGDDRGKIRFKHGSQEDDGKFITFKAYCKPNTWYTLTKRNVNKELSRLAIAGFPDEPNHGEAGEKYAYNVTGGGSQKDEAVETFRTGPNINYLVLYLGRTTKAHGPIEEVVQNIQLEEGKYSTSYEPQRIVRKTVAIDKQLYDNEYLYWKPENPKEPEVGRYYIHELIPGRPGETKEAPTDITNEELIHTFEGATYVYLRTKIPSEVIGEFPIKANDDYYTKQEVDQKETALSNYVKENYYDKTQFVFRDSSSTEENNLLRLPGGFTMVWKEVQISSTSEETVSLPIVGQIIHAQVTPIYEETSGENLERNVTINVKIKDFRTIGLLKSETSRKVKKVMLLVIGKQILG